MRPIETLAYGFQREMCASYFLQMLLTISRILCTLVLAITTGDIISPPYVNGFAPQPVQINENVALHM
ncbi:MAG TPA: hypothetical protein VNE63_18830 [Candidatus Acidoferrales bacterium]|nr:hypothetical protein [Candidatus Acidoferrales bacterium]